MKNFGSVLFLSLVLSLGISFVSCGGGETSNSAQTEEKQGKEYTSAYVCPMHCEGSGSDEPGTCPVCNMVYVENKEHSHDGDGHSHDHDDHEGHNH